MAAPPTSSTPVGSLSHIALPLAVFFDRRIRRSDCGEEELHRVSALVANLVTEIKPIDLSGVAHHLAIAIAAATPWFGRRDDPLRVFVARSFVINVLDDVLHDAICPRIRVLLPDVAADSSQMIFLATGFPSLSRGFCDPTRRSGWLLGNRTRRASALCVKALRHRYRHLSATWDGRSEPPQHPLPAPAVWVRTQPLRCPYVRTRRLVSNLGTSGRPHWRRWSGRCSANRSRATWGHGCANASREHVTIPES